VPPAFGQVDDEEAGSGIHGWVVNVAGNGAAAAQPPAALDASLTDILLAQALAERDQNRRASGNVAASGSNTATGTPQVSSDRRRNASDSGTADSTLGDHAVVVPAAALHVSSSADAVPAAQPAVPVTAASSPQTSLGTLSAWLTDDGQPQAVVDGSMPAVAHALSSDGDVLPALSEPPLHLVDSSGAPADAAVDINAGNESARQFVTPAAAGRRGRRGTKQHPLPAPRNVTDGETSTSASPGRLQHGEQQQQQEQQLRSLPDSSSTGEAPLSGGKLSDYHSLVISSSSVGGGYHEHGLPSSAASHLLAQPATLHMHDLASRASSATAGSTRGRGSGGRRLTHVPPPPRFGVSFAGTDLVGLNGAEPITDSLLRSSGGVPQTVVEGADEHDGTQLSDDSVGGDAAAAVPPRPPAALPLPPAHDDDFVGGAAAAEVLRAAHADWADDQRFIIRAHDVLRGAQQHARGGAAQAQAFDGAVSSSGGGGGHGGSSEAAAHTFTSSALTGSLGPDSASMAGAAVDGYTPFFAERSEPIDPLSGSRGYGLGRSSLLAPSGDAEAPTTAGPGGARGPSSGTGSRRPLQFSPPASASASSRPSPASAADREGQRAGAAVLSPPSCAAEPVSPSRNAATADAAAARSSVGLPTPPAPAAVVAVSALQVPRSLATLTLRPLAPAAFEVTVRDAGDAASNRASPAPGFGGGSLSHDDRVDFAPSPAAAQTALRLPLRNAGPSALTVQVAFAKLTAMLECPGHGVPPVAIDLQSDDEGLSVSPLLSATPQIFDVTAHGVTSVHVQVCAVSSIACVFERARY
jgi:hypothetical protein